MKRNSTHADKFQEEKRLLTASNISSPLFYTKNQIADSYAYMKRRYTGVDKFQGDK